MDRLNTIKFFGVSKFLANFALSNIVTRHSFWQRHDNRKTSLLVRGFNVDVGVVPKQVRTEEGNRIRQYYEVDFVCNQGSRRYYIQSAYRMIDEEKVRQEEASLRNIDDSFKKIIILGESTPVIRNESGITIISIYDFLLNDNSLEL